MTAVRGSAPLYVCFPFKGWNVNGGFVMGPALLGD